MTTAAFLKILSGSIMAAAAFVAVISLCDLKSNFGSSAEGAATAVILLAGTIGRAVTILLLAAVVYLMASSKALLPQEHHAGTRLPPVGHVAEHKEVPRTAPARTKFLTRS
jgi:hypothetical protein